MGPRRIFKCCATCKALEICLRPTSVFGAVWDVHLGAAGGCWIRQSVTRAVGMPRVSCFWWDSKTCVHTFWCLKLFIFCTSALVQQKIFTVHTRAHFLRGQAPISAHMQSNVMPTGSYLCDRRAARQTCMLGKHWQYLFQRSMVNVVWPINLLPSWFAI